MTRRGHGLADDQWTPTHKVAHCAVCGVQWVVKDANYGDATHCEFCGAPESAISVVSEAPDYGGAVIQGPR